MISKRAFLIILDGWGIAEDPSRSAIDLANKPFFDQLWNNFPHTTLTTYGSQVGLPDGQMGNSEVGHLNIGAGRVVYQDLAKINKAIKDDELKSNPVLQNAIQYANDHNTNIHLIGLVSDGGVHAHIDHLKALCDIMNKTVQNDCFIHAFLDGRDTAPDSGIGYIKDLQDHIENTNCRLSSLIGRYYAMDRDNRWERVKLAYDLLVHGKGQHSIDAIESIQASYDVGTTDEFMPAIKMDLEKKSTISDGDVVLFFNYRTDRPRELSQVLCQSDNAEYDMKALDLHFVTMTKYDDSFQNVHIMYEKDNLKNTIGEVLEAHGKTQVRIAETEKYPHVTFFFSGGREKEFDGESRLLVPSPKVATYDLQPEMSADQVTESIIKDINTDPKDFICLNFANTDMVGHTGDIEAAIRSTEKVDECLAKIIPTALAKDYGIVIIADHGNSDIMKNEDGSAHTAHTLNPVPCILVAKEIDGEKLNEGALCDVAPTLLHLLDVQQPDEMTGESLIH